MTEDRSGYNLMSTYDRLCGAMWVTQSKALQEIGLSAETLRRYRRDGILKAGRDWKYGDAHQRSLKYNLENVEAAMESFRKRNYRSLEQVTH